MGGSGKRVGNTTEHVRSSAQYGTEGRLATIALPHLQEARGEVGARQRIFWTQSERVAEGISSSRVLSVKKQRPGEFCQNVRASRRSVASDNEDIASLCALIVLEQQAPLIDFQVDALWSQRKAIFDGPDSFVQFSDPGKLACEFLKSRQVRWTPCSGAP